MIVRLYSTLVVNGVGIMSPAEAAMHNLAMLTSDQELLCLYNNLHIYHV